MRKLLGLALVLLTGVSTAYADSVSAYSAPAAASSQSSASELLEKMKKNVRATYLLWLRGPSTRALSGNDAGGGTNLQLTHYFALGYRISSKWTVSVTQPFTQTIDEKPAKQVDPFTADNPYLSLTNPRIMASQRYGLNLVGQIRYYAPFSRAASVAVAKASTTEIGNGMVRILLAPSKTWMDGALSFTANTFMHYRFASRSSAERAALNSGNPHRDDMLLVFDPVLAYAFTDKVEGYLEYAFDMTHSTQGGLGSKWTSWKSGDYISPGANLQLTKKFLLNPYLVVQPRIDDLDQTGIGLQATYSFL